MDRRHSPLLFTLGALALAACSTPEPPPAPTITSMSEDAPGSALRENIVQVSATVTAIDPKTRMVTLIDSDGEPVTFRVDDAVRNLAQVKKGDIVQATYYRSVAIQLHKAGTQPPAVSAAQASGRAEPGEKPGAAGVRTATIVATIRGLDREAQTATLELADGTLKTVDVRNPDQFDVAAVGDLVEITFTEAVAIAVEKPGKP